MLFTVELCKVFTPTPITSNLCTDSSTLFAQNYGIKSNKSGWRKMSIECFFQFFLYIVNKIMVIKMLGNHMKRNYSDRVPGSTPPTRTEMNQRELNWLNCAYLILFRKKMLRKYFELLQGHTKNWWDVRVKSISFTSNFNR